MPSTLAVCMIAVKKDFSRKQGAAKVLSAHFTQPEIAMMIVAGLASAAGIVAFVEVKSSLSAWHIARIFVAFAAVQLLCFPLSPEVEHSISLGGTFGL